MRITLTVAVLGMLSGSALAQPFSNVRDDHKYSWGENIGFMNWRDAVNDTKGVRVRFASGGFMSGYIWGENVGWINTGNGAGPYANTNNTNFGVNVNLTTGALTGFAWGENIGWINFSGGAMATPPNAARVDLVARRLRGFAWGENVGWINLDNATDFVGLFCLTDVNEDGVSNSTDVSDFINYWFQDQVDGTFLADFDLNGVVNSTDVSNFINAWFDDQLNCH
jgi:hypothetical protein